MHYFHRKLISLSLLALATATQAQNTAPAPAASSPAKKELVARIMKVQQPAIEGMARDFVQQPALDILSSAGNVLPQRVAKEKQESVAKDIQADVQKYLDDAVPLVQRRAVALAPSTVGSLLEDKFTEDELKQIATTLESPAFIKFQRMGDDMQKALAEKLVAETRPQIEPKVRALQETVGRRLGVPAQGAQGSAPAAPAAPSKAPAKK
jgi:hypothetical protein